MTNLLSCPFCGGHPIETPISVECARCTAETSPEEWNRRTPGPATRAFLDWFQSQWKPDTLDAAIEEFEALKVAFLAEWEDSTS